MPRKDFKWSRNILKNDLRSEKKSQISDKKLKTDKHATRQNRNQKNLLKESTSDRGTVWPNYRQFQADTDSNGWNDQEKATAYL